MGKEQEREANKQKGNWYHAEGERYKQEADNVGEKLKRLRTAKKEIELQINQLNQLINQFDSFFDQFDTAADVTAAGWKGELRKRCEIHCGKAVTSLKSMENDYQTTLKNINGEIAKQEASQLNLLEAAHSCWDMAVSWWNAIV